MSKTKSYAAQSATTPLAPHTIERRDSGPKDIEIDIQYCGVCHSDLHTARNEWQNTTYPAVPGHEIVGRVTRVGSEVKKLKVGDLAAVGCMVDSCRHCANCQAGLEQYCLEGFTGTYNSPDKHFGGTVMTYGGYSKTIIVDDAFVLSIPQSFSAPEKLAAVAPLLCAGITTYSPLRHWKVGPGQKVGVVGLGGLGHMALKIAHALGADVTLFTTSTSKVEDAKRLGANHVIISKNADEMNKHLNSFDFILDTVAATHDINAYLALLKTDATMVQVGAPEQPLPLSVFSVIMGRRSFAGSLIGGIPETQEMLEFCAKHGITSDIELIPIDYINTAYERMLKSDVKYRFVIDMATLK